MVMALALILLSLYPVRGQELAIVRYGIRDGLPSAYISCLAQGADGRLWIGHSAGVSAYDGRSFENFDADDGLIGEGPSSLVATADGYVWLSFPQKGIQFISRDGEVSNVPDPNRLLVQDHVAFLYSVGAGHKVIAAGDKGYYRVSRSGVSGPFYPLDGKTGVVTTILETEERSGFLASTEDGIFQIHNGTANPYDLPDNDDRSSPEISVMARGPNGDLWLVGAQGRLFHCESTAACRSWDISQSGNQPYYPYRLAVDGEGVVWIASSCGLQRFADGEVETLTEDQGLSNSFAIDLLVDRDQVLWVATESGLDKISQPAFRNFKWQKNFPVNSVWVIEELPDGTVWMGTNDGIVSVDPEWRTKVWTDADGLPEQSIVDIKATDRGEVWVLGYSGLYRWDGRKFNTYPQADLELLNLYEVMPVNDREVWICTSYGIFQLDPQTNRLTPHPLNQSLNGSRIITRALPARDGGVWLLGSKLYRWDPESRLTEVLLPADWKVSSVRNLLETDDGLVVLTDRGLAVLKGSAWHRYQPDQKQLFDFVRTADGTIWLGCNGGIGRFDGSDFEFFGFYDGVALGECNTGAALLDSRGVVWLGGVNVSLVRPSLLRTPPVAVPAISTVSVSGKNQRFPSRLELPSTFRNLEIQFAAPSFWNEQEQFFRSRLDGFDSDWSSPTNRGSVQYSALPPGEYTFRVQCRPQNGSWSEAPTPLFVVVSPAWWQTIYARALFVFGLIISGVFIGLFRVQLLKARQSKLEQLVDQQTVEIKRQRDAMALLATTDDLTLLPNRRKCSELLEREMARASRTGNPFSVFLFDVDLFKGINDDNGHDVGDRVLIRIAKVGQEVVRATDTLGRWGGDEFILLMPDTENGRAWEVCRRLKQAVEDSTVMTNTGTPVKVTISGGISTYQSEEEGEPLSIGRLVRGADEALYRAKEDGRSRIA